MYTKKGGQWPPFFVYFKRQLEYGQGQCGQYNMADHLQ